MSANQVTHTVTYVRDGMQRTEPFHSARTTELFAAELRQDIRVASVTVSPV
jgi:hypothetical protein